MSTTSTTANAPVGGGDDVAQARIAADFLARFLNKLLHVHTNDGRTFVGQLKCTDRERNLILAVTHEYRAVEGGRPQQQQHRTDTDMPPPEMRKRFVGLVVVPGQYITKIEVED